MSTKRGQQPPFTGAYIRLSTGAEGSIQTVLPAYSLTTYTTVVPPDPED